MVNLTDNQLIILFTIVIVVLTAFSILLFIYYQKKQKLEFVLGPSFSLVNIKETYKDKIKVLYDDIIYNELSSIQVTIRNSGNSSIQRSNIKIPIKFKFDEDIKVIDSKVINKKPEGIIFNINKLINNEFNIDFELLNPGYEIKLQFVCVGGEVELPEIDASMIADTHINIIDYEDYLVEKNVFKNFKYFILTSFLAILVVYLPNFLSNNSYILILSLVIGIALTILSLIFFIYTIWPMVKDIYFTYKK